MKTNDIGHYALKDLTEILDNEFAEYRSYKIKDIELLDSDEFGARLEVHFIDDDINDIVIYMQKDWKDERDDEDVDLNWKLSVDMYEDNYLEFETHSWTIKYLYMAMLTK